MDILTIILEKRGANRSPPDSQERPESELTKDTLNIFGSK
jgi:hypothetical protein